MKKFAPPILLPLDLDPKSGRRRWKFLEDWYVDLPDGRQCHIPRGYIVDGASVPRLLWAVYSPTGMLFFPSMVHDFAIREGHLVLDGQQIEYTWRQSDDLFHALIRQFGGSSFGAGPAWLGVRIGSWFRTTER